MTALDKKYYTQDVKKFTDQMSILKIINKGHYEITFVDNSVVSIVLEENQYFLDLISFTYSKEIFKEFKFYLDCIVEFKDAKRFIKNLYKYYNTGKVSLGGID